MIEEITELIESRSASATAGMAAPKANTFRLSAYAGLRHGCDGCDISVIAAEIGCSESWVHKLLTKWKKALNDGSVAANAIVLAYNALDADVAKPRRPRGGKGRPATRMVVLPSTYATPEEMLLHEARKASDQHPKKGRRCLGFLITREDELRMRASVRGSIRFLATFGKGRTPRMHGEYFQPREVDAVDGDGVWITQDQASLYCGCPEERLQEAAERGEVMRRVYKRRGSRTYYEYCCADLDAFIQENGLV